MSQSCTCTLNLRLRSLYRVVPLLTASFLEEERCIDQFNIALCCNRQMKRHLLAPLCMDQIQTMPVYMGMVQWENCRLGQKGCFIFSSMH